MNEVACTVHATRESFEAAGPGAIQFFTSYGRDEDSRPVGMLSKCPGCGHESSMDFKPRPSPSWEWDGNLEKPTLSPSVNCVGCCQWHGYLVRGKWFK